MSNQPLKYVKLPGQGYRSSAAPGLRIALFFVIGLFALLLRGKKVQLWLGDDHLLVVDTDGYTEDYKRYYFKDVQGIVVRRTVEGRLINFLLSLPVLLFGVLGIEKPGFLFVAAVFLVFLILNIAQGATCEAELFTAVQSEKLVSLSRVKTARKVLDRLQPLIIAAQGELKVEEMAAAGQDEGRATAATSYSAPQSSSVAEIPYRGKVHLWLSWVALADVVGTTVTVLAGQELMRLYSMGHMAAVGILSLIALNAQKNTTLPMGLKRLPIVLLVGLAGCFTASFFFGIYMAVAEPHSVETMRENPMGSPWQVVMTIISTGINTLGGLYGVLSFRRYQRAQQPAVPPQFDPPTAPPTSDLPA
jgi:hypothetical protein